MPFPVAFDLVCSCELECCLWVARFRVGKWFEWSGALPDGGRDRCRVCRIEPAVSAVVDDSRIGCPYEKHLNCGDQSLIVLHTEIRDGEILLE